MENFKETELTWPHFKAFCEEIGKDDYSKGRTFLRPGKNVCTKQAQWLCGSVLSQKDKVIFESICDQIGDKWTALELKDRCHVLIFPDKREVFCLDNVQLLEFFPISSKTVSKKNSVKFHFEQQYRKLYKN